MTKVLAEAYGRRGPFPADPEKWSWHVVKLADALVGHLEKLANAELDFPDNGNSWGPLGDDD